MKKICILGAGTAGTMMANHLSRTLDKRQWRCTIVDQYDTHYYQPGFLFVPFGIYRPQDVRKEKKRFIPAGTEYVQARVEEIDHKNNRLVLTNTTMIEYDILIIASGCRITPEQVAGLGDGEWHKSIFDFYTIEGATALAGALSRWKGGKLVIHFAEMPIKCPVAPLEFAFLADWWFSKKGIRSNVEMTYVTPLPGAFTKQTCSKALGSLLTDKKIKLVPDFAIERVEAGKKKMSSYDGQTVDYDLLVTVPTNMGDPVIGRSGLGDDLNFVPTDRHILQSKAKENIFVIGDATDLPSSKAGSVAHFQAEILTHNIMAFIKGKPLSARFDGHANCFIESGFKKAFLIDFNYDLEPVTGSFPLPVLGPFRLLKQSRLNHFGKMAFKWIYWNMLLRGYPMPGVSAAMTTVGKNIPKKKRKEP
jgi:sulfide:quinone oxidoreductase